MYSLLSEGYTASYSPSGDRDREVRLKTDSWVKAYEIPEMLKNLEAIEAIEFYLRWKRMGMPYGPWGMNPNKLVEVVELLDPLDGFYHPRVIWQVEDFEYKIKNMDLNKFFESMLKGWTIGTLIGFGIVAIAILAFICMFLF